MKIISDRFVKAKTTSSNSKKSSKSEKSFSVQSFSKMIDETADEPILESLFSDPDSILSNISMLADEMDKLGQELAEKPLPETFNKYKRHIGLLLKGITRNVEIQETSARVGFTRTKLFKTAQAIDTILADLATNILSNEKHRIDILKLTNQLQGLVLDLIA